MDKRKTEIIKKLRGFKLRLLKQLQLQQMILFGSTARSEFRKDSDIDLILISKDFSKVSPLKRAYMVSKYWNLNYPKDLLCYTPEEFEKLKKHSVVVKEAVNEGIEI